MKFGPPLGFVGLLAIVLFVPSAAAHPFGTPIDNPSNRERCYYYDDHDTNTRQIWLETNGILEGGVPEAQEWFGLPALFGGPGSGLQRTASGGIPADTLLSPIQAVFACGL